MNTENVVVISARGHYLVWGGLVVCLVGGCLQVLVLIVVCHQLHAVLSLTINHRKNLQYTDS